MGMVVPISSQSDPRFADQDTPTMGPGMPSETNLLMALAEMNRQGRVASPSPSAQLQAAAPPAKPQSRAVKRTLKGNN